jgi:hypothetical protein
MNGQGRSHAGGGLRLEEGDDMWGWGVSDGERGKRVPLRAGVTGPWARSGSGSDLVPRPFSLFFVLLFFYFIFSFAK